MPHHLHHSQLLETINGCETMCEHMTTHVLAGQDLYGRKQQLLFLRDCADICSFTSKYIARHSMFSKHTAKLCATICEVCGNECLQFPDPESQRCGQICLNCASECLAFASA